MKHLKFICIVLVLTGCHSIKYANTLKTTPPLLPGFTLIASPNSLDKPGSVIAVNKKGVAQYLTSIDISKLETGIIQPPDASGNRTSSISALFNFLGMDKYAVDAGLNSKFDKKFEYKISLKNCSQERIPLLNIDGELEKMRQAIKIFGKSNNMQDYKYYIITDAIKAKDITYQFDDGKVGDIDLKVNINKIIDVNPKVQWVNQSNLTLNCTLNESLYVYAKYWSLNVQSQITGGTILKVGHVIKQDPIYEKHN